MDMPKFATLGEEILTSEVSRYYLVARTEDRKDLLVVPLCLDGSESPEQAISRFKDALAVSRQCFSQKGEYFPASESIDGRARSELDHAKAAFMAKATEVGWVDVNETEEFKRLQAMMPRKPKFLGIFHQGNVI